MFIETVSASNKLLRYLGPAILQQLFLSAEKYKTFRTKSQN